MASLVISREGDTLCGLAIAAGFVDCQPIRDEPLNKGEDFLKRPTLKDGEFVFIPDKKLKEEAKATNKRHVFVKRNAPPVSIRFVHGSKTKPYLLDEESLYLNISQYQTDKGGKRSDKNFPDQFDFQQAGDDDRDTFKVEVVDPAAGGTVKVVLEALKPVYKADGTIDHHENFAGAERGKRKLEVDCKKVRSGVAFRSKYLRLVSDEADHDGTVGPNAPNGFVAPAGTPKPQQTLLVTDISDQGEPNVEILDQLVRASYEIQRCPGAPKCAATKTVPVGSEADTRKPKKRVKVVVHILQTAVGGAGVVTIANADRRVHKWMRRILAQLSITPKFAQPTRLVNPVENMVVIGDPNGPVANGDGQFSFRIKAPGKASQVVGPHAPAAGDGTAVTAAALAALVQPPYSAKVFPNPARFPDPVASFATDILITEASGAHVSIDQVQSTDSGQTVTVARPSVANLQSWDGNNFLVGSPDQRAIIRNYDSGSDRVDVFVVQNVTLGDRGEAMMPGVSIDPNRAATNEIKLSVFMIQSAMDGTDNDPLPLAHECGHVVGDVGHATSDANELMCDKVSGNNATGGSKRVRDGMIRYDMLAANPRFQNMNLTTLFHTTGAVVLDAW